MAKYHLASIDIDQVNRVRLIAITLDAISMAASALLVISFFILRHYDPRRSKRVSMHLTVAAAIADFLYFLFQMVIDISTGHQTGCQLIMWGSLSFFFLSLFLNAMIAVNLQIILLHQCVPKPYLKYIYYSVSVAIAFAITVASRFSGFYGWNANLKACWFVGDSKAQYITRQASTYTLCVMLVIIYSVIISGLIFWKTWRESRLYHAALKEVDDQTAAGLTNVRENIRARLQYGHIVRRVMLYPLVPVFTQIPWIVTDATKNASRIPNEGMLVFSIICASLQGVVFLGIYCLDPSARMALRTTMSRIRRPIKYKSRSSSWNSTSRLSRGSTMVKSVAGSKRAVSRRELSASSASVRSIEAHAVHEMTFEMDCPTVTEIPLVHHSSSETLQFPDTPHPSRRRYSLAVNGCLLAGCSKECCGNDAHVDKEEGEEEGEEVIERLRLESSRSIFGEMNLLVPEGTPNMDELQHRLGSTGPLVPPLASSAFQFI